MNPHTYIRISIIDRCNLRCWYCMPAEGIPLVSHDEILTYDEIEEVARAAVSWGIRKVRITGGEPLIRRNVMQLFRQLNTIDDLDQITVTTNGILLDQFADEMCEIGVSSVNVSLDSLRPERLVEITRCGDGRKQLEAIDRGLESALRAGIERVKLNVVLMRGINDDELLDFVQMSVERPIVVRFIEMMPVATDYEMFQKRFISAKDMRQRITEHYKLTSVPIRADGLAGPAREYSVEDRSSGRVGRIGIISGISESFCDNCNRLRLTCHGDLLPCLADEDAINLRPILRRPHTISDITNVFDKVFEIKSSCERPGGGHSCYTKLTSPMSQIGG